jgi:hypothetical protein
MIRREQGWAMGTEEKDIWTRLTDATGRTR